MRADLLKKLLETPYSWLLALPPTVKNEVLWYTLTAINQARYYHAASDDSISSILYRTLPYQEKIEHLNYALETLTYDDINRLRPPYNLSLLAELVLDNNVLGVELLADRADITQTVNCPDLADVLLFFM